MAEAAFVYRSKVTSSSDSDSSDSDNDCRDWKRASKKPAVDEDLEKIPIQAPKTNVASSLENNSKVVGRKRNNIWGDVLDDQLMSETLGDCGLKAKPKGYGSRGAESYDFTLGYKYRRVVEDFNDKMSEDETSETAEVNSLPPFRNTNSNKFVELDGAGVTAAKKIIKSLGEQKHYLIFRVVKFVGIETAMKLLKMTEDIEENGGMMIKNLQRRRTPGGVYFQLLKTDKNVGKEAVDKIFEGEMNSFQLKKHYQENKEKRKKSAAVKKARKEKFKKVPQSNNPPKEEPKMETESEVMEEEEIPNVDIGANVNGSKDSDLEDGELDD